MSRTARGWMVASALLGLVQGSCTCLNLEQQLAYVCNDDSQCVAPSRCGTNHVCVDPTGDQLRGNANAPAVSVVLVSPSAPLGLPDVVATDPIGTTFISPCSDGGTDKEHAWESGPVVAQVRGSELSVLTSYRYGRLALPDGGLPSPSGCSAGGLQVALRDRAVASLGAAKAIDAIVVDDRAWVLTQDGGLCSYRFTPGSPNLAGGCSPNVLPFAATSLRSREAFDGSGRTLPPYAIAFSQSQYALISLWDGGISSPQTVKSPLGIPRQIRDIALQGQNGFYTLIAATDAGFFATGFSGTNFTDGGVMPVGTWESASLDPVACETDPAMTSDHRADFARSIRFVPDQGGSGEDLLAVHTLETNTTSVTYPQDHVRFYRSSYFIGPGVPYPCSWLPSGQWSAGSRKGYKTTSEAANCIPCDADHGYLLTSYRVGVFTPAGGSSTVSLEARCAPNDGGAEVSAFVPDVESCGRTDELPLVPQYVASTRWSTSDPEYGAYANDLGHLYAESRGTRLGLQSLTLDRAPSALARTSRGLSATLEALSQGNPLDPDGTTVISERRGYPEVAGDLVPDPFNIFATWTEVQGKPTWAVVGGDPSPFYMVVEHTTSQPYSLTSSFEFRPIALVPISAIDPFVPPFRAAVVENSQDTILLLSSGDALLSAKVTATARSDAGFDPTTLQDLPFLELAAVKLPRTPVTSLLGLSPAPFVVAFDAGVQGGTAPYAEAYMVQGGRVFYVNAPNERLWHIDELELGGLEVLTVMADGRRGRAGTRDGQVYALPSRTRLAPSLPGGNALEFAQLGVTTFALAKSGVYRLRSDGVATVGTWEAVAIPGLPPAMGYGGARLIANADDLLLFLNTGWTYRINGGR